MSPEHGVSGNKPALVVICKCRCRLTGWQQQHQHAALVNGHFVFFATLTKSQQKYSYLLFKKYCHLVYKSNPFPVPLFTLCSRRTVQSSRHLWLCHSFSWHLGFGFFTTLWLSQTNEARKANVLFGTDYIYSNSRQTEIFCFMKESFQL